MTSNSVAVLSDLGAEINDTHAQAIHHANEAMGHAVQCGELLNQAKATVPHGKWLPWLRENITFSERTAQVYMRIADRMPRQIRNGVADLSVRGVLKQLSTPRKHALQPLLDDLASWMGRGAERTISRPEDPADWSVDDARACVDSIREFDQIAHKHGLCEGADDCCTICWKAAEDAVARGEIPAFDITEDSEAA